jgi:hypothetical protein
MKYAALFAALGAACVATGAQAESFTGTYKNDAINLVMVPASQGAPAQGGAAWKGVTTSTTKSGVTTSSNYSCVGWLTPGQGTTNAAACEASDNATDKWSAYILCAADPNDANKPSSCWGALVGTGGKYAGKTGQFVQHGTNASGTSEGAWND